MFNSQSISSKTSGHIFDNYTQNKSNTFITTILLKYFSCLIFVYMVQYFMKCVPFLATSFDELEITISLILLSTCFYPVFLTHYFLQQTSCFCWMWWSNTIMVNKVTNRWRNHNNKTMKISELNKIIKLHEL